MRLFNLLKSPGVEQRGEVVSLFESWNSDKSEGQLSDFKDYVTRAYRANGVVFALVAARARVQSEISFAWRQPDGSLSDAGTELRALRRPWTNGTVGMLVQRMEQDASLAGNAYVYRPNSTRFQRLNPDWVQILTDGVEPVAYWYTLPGKPPALLDANEVAHYVHEPDPLANYRGMSWVQSVATEILGDQAMQKHKQKFFDNAATPNMIIKFQETLDPQRRKDLQESLERKYGSVENAYKTLFVDNGADVQIVGSDLSQLAFADVQGAAEVRMCNAAGTPPIVIGVTKGLESGTYSNYGLAFRSWMDTLHRPEWRKKAEALESVLKPPRGATRLWYDDRQVPALQQDALDAADIRGRDAGTIRTLVDGGFDPDGTVDAVMAGDLSTLSHTGLTSVQLLPPDPGGGGDEPVDEQTDDSLLGESP